MVVIWYRPLRLKSFPLCSLFNYGSSLDCQTIIWTNDGLVYWRIYVSLGLIVLRNMCRQNYMYVYASFFKSGSRYLSMSIYDFVDLITKPRL